MANTALLQEKAEQLQAELNQWALENGALDLGEEIIFSLRVGKSATIVRRDPQDLEGKVKCLEITKDHVKLCFTYVAPACLNDDETEQVLALLGNKARKKMQILLHDRNNPIKIDTRTDGNFYETANRALRDFVLNGKKYRMVRNRIRGLEYYAQLWEIEGELNASFNRPNTRSSA